MKNLTREEAAARAALLQVDSYDVHLDVTAPVPHFTSHVEVRFRCRQPGASTFVELDGELLGGELNGKPLGAASGNRIALEDLGEDNVLRVRAQCAYSRSGEGLHRFLDPADGNVYLYAQSFLDDAQRVFACFDQPDLKASFRLTVDALPHCTVLGNSRGTRDGNRWTFQPTRRISTYLFCLAVGPWHGEQRRYGDVELGVWCRQSLAQHLEADEMFGITEQAFAFQQPLFGCDYPFGDTYDQVFVPEFNAGAMENPGLVTFSEDLLFRSRVTQGKRRLRAMVIAHELSHQWFGNLVTMRWWDDLWLNESFAELMGYLTVDRATDYRNVWIDFATSRKAWGYRSDALPTRHPVAGNAPDARSALLDFDGISYAKGASVLRQLMATLGEDAFFTGVRGYLDEHAYANSAFPDLLRHLEQASGRDLHEWAQAWLRESGTSTLRPVRTGEHVVVEQTSPNGVLREHRIDVGSYVLSDNVLVLADRTPAVVAGPRTRLPLPVDPVPDLLLLNEGDLTFAKLRFDDRSLSTVLTDLHRLGDPLARALCWSALWDATRDAELPAAQFVAAVLANVAGEPDPSVVETLLTQALLAAAMYTETGDALRRSLAEASWRAAEEATPGDDLQLVRVRSFTHAADAEHGARLRGLLDGTHVPSGLRVDTELRWEVLQRLCALGLAGEREIGQELARDRSASGDRSALTARAARPDVLGKQQAFERAAHDATLSSHEAQALAQGFWQLGQESLLRPYVDAYVDVVPALWRTWPPNRAAALTRLLFPRTLVSRDVVAETGELLDADDVPPPGKRIVVEQRDDLERAERARASVLAL